MQINFQILWLRLRAYIRHLFGAWNTRGEGIHSPYLFYLTNSLLWDDNAFYCWKAIEQQRALFQSNTQELKVKDYGTGNLGKEVYIRRVCDIANTSLEKPEVAQLFFRWLVFLSQQAQKPLTIFELGTSLGITTSYLAKPHSRNRVITFEGSKEIAHQALQLWQRLGIDNIELKIGNIDSTLSGALSGNKVDFAFVDANHTYDATMRYVHQLLKYIHPKTIIAIDDIHYSEEMEQAWYELQQLPQVTTTIDFLHVGVLFFDPHYIQKNYRIKLKKHPLI